MITWLINRRRILIALILLIFFITLYSPVNLGPSSASPAIVQQPYSIEKDRLFAADGDDWLTGWQYRQPLEFTEVGSAGTNYQIKFHVEYGSGAAAVNTIWTDSHCLTDFGDVRFTDGNGNTELKYWIEESTPSDDATFWVKVDDSLSLGQTTRIYIYYGKAGESTTSDGEDTFIFFDDFNDASIDTAKWDVITGTPVESGGILTVAVSAYERIRTDATFGAQHRMVTDAYIGNGGSYTGGAMGFRDGGGITDYWEDAYVFMYWNRDGTGRLRTATDSNLQQTVIDYYAAYHRWEIGWDASKVRFFKDSVMIGSHEDYLPTGSDYIDISSYRTNSWVYVDWVFVGKYQTTEPWVSGSNVGPEEEAQITAVGSVVTNADNPDSNHLYTYKRLYVATANVTMQSGYEDVDYIRWFLQTSGSVTKLEIKYTEATDTFSGEVAIGFAAALGYCSNVSSGTHLDLTIYFAVLWTAENSDTWHLRLTAYDDFGGTDWDDFGDYDVETRLVLSPFSLNDGSGVGDRGNYSVEDGITASGTVYYYGGTVSPPTNIVDVWVSCTNVTGSPWSDLSLTDGVFSMTVDSDDIVDDWEDIYTFKVVQEGAGAGGADECHTTHTDTYIADGYTVSFMVGDNRINVNTNATVTYTVLSDYDGKAYDGTINLNYTTWQQATVQRQGFTVSSLSGDDTDGVTAISTNDADYVIWDQIEVYFSSESDARTNIDEQEYPYFRLRLKYDNHLLDDSTNDAAWINGSVATWNVPSSAWSKYYTQSSVGTWNFLVTSASENTYGITAFDSASASTYDSDIIWDRIQVQSYTVVDTRVNVNDNVNIDILLWYDFDNTQVTDGTVTINGFTATHQGSGVWRITRTSATVTDVTYNNVQCSGNTHGITVEDQNGQSQQVIWDQIKVLLIISNSTYNELNDYILLTVELEYEFDHVSITAGTFSLRYGSTYLTLTHDASGNWTVTDSSASATSRTYNFVNGTATLYSITVVNMDSKSATVHWDVIILDITINLTWTIGGYNVSITITGIYSGLGWTWNGTATLNSTWAIPYYPTQSTVGNFSYVVTSITNDDTSLVGFNGDYTVWCVWDDLTFSHGIDWYYANLYTSYFFWGGLVTPMQFTWSYNGSPVADSPAVTIQSYLNGTADTFGVISTGTLGIGYLGGVMLGPFDETWYFVDIQINAAFGAYNWSIWSSVVTVDVLHSIHFSVFRIDETENYIIFEWYVEHENTTWVSVWENDVLVYNHTTEGSHRFVLKTTAGTYNLKFLINQSMYLTWAGQTNDTSLTDDWWAWNTYTYIVDATYGWAYVSPYVTTGEGIELGTFKLYVNGSRIYDRDWRFYDRTDYAYEICVKDFFDNELYNTTHPWARNIDILLTYYTVKIYSHIQTLPIYFTLTMSGATWSEYLGIGEILRYYLAAGTYRYTFVKGGTVYTGDLVLGVDYYYVVTDIDLWDIWNQPKGGGGDDDAMELYILMVLTYGIIGIFGFMFIIQIPAIMNWFTGRIPRQKPRVRRT